MLSIKGKEFTLTNGPFKVSVRKDLDLPKKERISITNLLENPHIPDTFALRHYFDGDTYIDLTKTCLKFHSHGGNALDVEVELTVNDDDIRSVLMYIITDFDSESDDDSSDGEYSQVKVNTNIKSMDKAETVTMSLINSP